MGLRFLWYLRKCMETGFPCLESHLAVPLKVSRPLRQSWKRCSWGCSRARNKPVSRAVPCAAGCGSASKLSPCVESDTALCHVGTGGHTPSCHRGVRNPVHQREREERERTSVVWKFEYSGFTFLQWSHPSRPLTGSQVWLMSRQVGPLLTSLRPDCACV